MTTLRENPEQCFRIDHGSKIYQDRVELSHVKAQGIGQQFFKIGNISAM